MLAGQLRVVVLKLFCEREERKKERKKEGERERKRKEGKKERREKNKRRSLLAQPVFLLLPFYKDLKMLMGVATF